MVQRPPAGTIPEGPGSYQFKSADGRVIYVGKASSLKQRLSNYFQDPRNMHPRTAQMVQTAATVEWIEVRNEVEALMLEYNLIKQHRPRFNIRLMDDKSYPFMAVTLDEVWPRAMVMRGTKRKGVKYFGPYAHAYAIRDTLDLLLRTFPIRTCSPSKFTTHEKLGRPCLLFHIEKCSGPCVGEITPEAYEALVRDLCQFLDGDTDEVVNRLKKNMTNAAGELEFELAARLRDRLAAVQRAIEKQQMVGDRSEDIDLIGLADDDLEAAVQVFYVRKGRVLGGRVSSSTRWRTYPSMVSLPAFSKSSMATHHRSAYQSWSSFRPIPKPSMCTRNGSQRPVAARCRSAWRNGAASVNCMRPSPAMRRKNSPATGCAAPPTTTAGPAP